LLLLAPLFPFMRFIDSYIVLKSIWGAWHTESNGQWISPVRRNADSSSTSGRHRLHLVPPLEEERAS
jgi:hypothetical protein